MSCSLQDGKSPLHLAVEKGHPGVIDILVNHGANVNTLDRVRNLHVHT